MDAEYAAAKRGEVEDHREGSCMSMIGCRQRQLICVGDPRDEKKL